MCKLEKCKLEKSYEKEKNNKNKQKLLQLVKSDHQVSPTNHIL